MYLQIILYSLQYFNYSARISDGAGNIVFCLNNSEYEARKLLHISDNKEYAISDIINGLESNNISFEIANINMEPRHCKILESTRNWNKYFIYAKYDAEEMVTKNYLMLFEKSTNTIYIEQRFAYSAFPKK